MSLECGGATIQTFLRLVKLLPHPTSTRNTFEGQEVAMGERKKREPNAEATNAPLKRLRPTAAAATTVGVSGATGGSEAASADSAFTWQSVQASAQQAMLKAIATAQSSPPSPSSPPPPPAAEIVQSLFKTACVVFLTSDEKSWVYHIPKWYREVYEHTHEAIPSLNDADTSNTNKITSNLPQSTTSAAYLHWLRRVWELHPKHHDAIKMFGKDVLMPRFQQVYGGDGYRFSGKSFAAQPIPSELAHCIETMQSMVVNPGDPGSPVTYLNGALVNWYANGEHYMGPHTDNERELIPQSPVFSLSLGATRRFVFTAKPKLTIEFHITCTKRLELELGDGDLVIMGGTTQETHKHALPKMKKCLDKRVNVTLRCFKKR